MAQHACSLAAATCLAAAAAAPHGWQPAHTSQPEFWPESGSAAEPAAAAAATPQASCWQPPTCLQHSGNMTGVTVNIAYVKCIKT